MNQNFSSEFRLRSGQDFARMRKGKRFQMHGLRCVSLKNDLNHGRIGFAVSRKYGNSVQRHHFKRCWREVFRCHAIKLSSLDILIVPMKPASEQIDLHAHATNILNKLLQHRPLTPA
ncbi:MAG: ribonuclease P protein component [Mariprofundaceae bacterium]